ncbi:MAG: biotin transporter BioY [Terriglobia bacterium]
MRAATSETILLEALLPRATLVQNVLLVVAGSLLVALCAQIAVPLPFSPVPVTGQTFAVLLLGATFGARRAAVALLLYLAEGAAGLPVFAPMGAPGLARFAGPTGGYLLAYPLAAFVLGTLLETAARRRLWYWLGAALAAETIILAGGAAWLKWVTRANWEQALLLGVVPFLPGDLIKVALVAVCLPASWWAVERRRQS